MKEKIKILLIVFLSFSSIFLLLLNYGITSSESIINKKRSRGNLIFESPALLADAVMPEYLGVNFGGEKHTVINNPKEGGIWQDSVEILKRIFEKEGQTIRSIDVITDEMYKTFMNQKSIVLNLNKDITTLTFLNSLGMGDLKEFSEKYQNLDSIYISLEKNFVIINAENTRNLLTFDNIDCKRLDTKISNMYLSDFNEYTLEKDFKYVPIVSKSKIEKVGFENILKTFDEHNIENIVFRFLGKEVNYIREIKEEEVQTIYVDGRKILKIGENGLISYYNPEQGPNKDRNLFVSLRSALAFISNNLGYDSSLYLKKITPIEVQGNLGFKMIFGKNSKGFKVDLVHDSIVDYIEIDVFNEHILRFSQLFRGESGGSKTYYEIDPTQELRPIIAKNIEIINQKLSDTSENFLTFEEVLEKISEAKVVYLDNGVDKQLKLSWRVIIDEEVFNFEIKTDE